MQYCHRYHSFPHSESLNFPFALLWTYWKLHSPMQTSPNLSIFLVLTFCDAYKKFVFSIHKNIAINNLFKWVFLLQRLYYCESPVPPCRKNVNFTSLSVLSCSESWFFYVFIESAISLITVQKKCNLSCMCARCHLIFNCLSSCSSFCTASVPTFLFTHIHFHR